MIDTQEYKKRLETERTDLEKQLADVGRPNPANPGEWEAIQKEPSQEADPNDQASALDDYQENRAITEVLNARHREVSDALSRMEDGSYGICTVCGAEIEKERLDADPTAGTCKEHLS